MQNGTELIKLRTNVRQFRRFFTLDADFAYVRWHPTNKKPHKARSFKLKINKLIFLLNQMFNKFYFIFSSS